MQQAFKLATDREALNDVLLEGRGVIGHNDPIAPVFADFYDDTLEQPAYDPEAARTLLAEAGYPDGLTLTLYTPDSLGFPSLATVLQQQWAEAGITVGIQVRPETVYYSTDEWTTVDLGITGWGARPTPQQFLTEAYASDGLYNESHWSDEELDSLIEQAGVTADTAERAACSIKSAVSSPNVVRSSCRISRRSSVRPVAAFRGCRLRRLPDQPICARSRFLPNKGT